MKILYITALNETINAFLVPHISRLINLGHEVHCACNINRNINSELKKYNVIYYNIMFGRNPLKINYINVIKEIKEIYRKNEYDIVHVHTPIVAFITRLALKKYETKIIYTAHGFHFYKGAPILNWLIYYSLERLASKWTDVLITINNEDYEIAKKFNLRKNGKVKLIHGVGINPEDYTLESFDSDSYREKLGINKNDFVMLILADINKNKNHLNVIKAIDSMKEKYPNIKVLCAGEGPLKNVLIKKVEFLKLENNIKFLGFRYDVKELLHSCDCVGLFSKREGLPKSLMEALCVGKPIITSNIRGCRDLVIHSGIGELVDSKKPLDIVNGLEIIINKKYICEEIKESIEIYKFDNVLKDIINIHNI
ncbi:glycosyltransferase family 4 protein [Clostridium perfringens]|nr:glycosyltransferase family 4 protein [Clostridium perfringens]